jgi:hypothetical protein
LGTAFHSCHTHYDFNEAGPSDGTLNLPPEVRQELQQLHVDIVAPPSNQVIVAGISQLVIASLGYFKL